MTKLYTAVEYVKIAISNSAGFEKSMSDNETKILWATDNDSTLEDFDAKDKMAYMDAVQALRDAQNGIPSGYICGMDAGASGKCLPL